MTCDLCGKQEATVHLTEIINEQTRELHLCEPCAKAKGVKVENPFGLADLLTGLTELGGAPASGAAASAAACPRCGMRFEDFKRSGRLGCGACYEAFRQPLAGLIKQVHGAARHVGHAPPATSSAASQQAELEGLKARLKQAVKGEAFEEAAQLRDQIRGLESPGKSKGAGRGQRGRRSH